MIVVDTTVWIDFFGASGTTFDRHLTRQTLLAHPILRARGLETFEVAANLYRAARRRGLTIRRTVDCLIGAICLEAGAAIYHNDRDYDALAKVSPLTIHRSA